jgi:SSS family solute:Na+ symporter
MTGYTATTLDFVIIVMYFLGILAFGTWFGRFSSSTKDFFFGGQRFSWWLISFSCVATVVGSYSFIKYSANGFNYGLSSAMTYSNDWFLIPCFILGWLPIIYFSRTSSIPEYFEKRFDRKTRVAGVVAILFYLVGYIGINLLTLGTAMEAILGVDLLVCVVVIAFVSAIYMHAGGQTSVIMTDLLQGVLLLVAGFVLLYLGIDALGGTDKFFSGLSEAQKLPFAKFNSPPKFHFVGVFWQDAFASSIAFYFMNQGTLMRFLSVKSPREGKKAMFFVVLILMPLAAISINNAGWIGRAMVTHGILPDTVGAKEIFVAVAAKVCQPGVFGLIMAALTAALMSTIDTLINATSAIVVNDIWKPYVSANRDDRYYLKVAKGVAIAAAVVGVLLVPIFDRSDSIYLAHARFIASVTPPMIVTILLGAFWKRFTPMAAFCTLIGGGFFIGLSFLIPELIKPFAHGVDPSLNYGYMRALYGISVSGGIAFVVSYITPQKSDESIRGLVIDSIESAKEYFKGSKPNDADAGKKFRGRLLVNEIEGITLSEPAMAELKANPGDIIYLADARWWLGGLRSIQLKANKPHNKGSDEIHLNQEHIDESKIDPGRPVSVEKIM